MELLNRPEIDVSDKIRIVGTQMNDFVDVVLRNLFRGAIGTDEVEIDFRQRSRSMPSQLWGEGE